MSATAGPYRLLNSDFVAASATGTKMMIALPQVLISYTSVPAALRASRSLAIRRGMRGSGRTTPGPATAAQAGLACQNTFVGLGKVVSVNVPACQCPVSSRAGVLV